MSIDFVSNTGELIKKFHLREWCDVVCVFERSLWLLRNIHWEIRLEAERPERLLVVIQVREGADPRILGK